MRIPFPRRRLAETARRAAAVVAIMGATGTGKSNLSIDIATRFRGEVINADKIQVYRGLDITTNKMPLSSRRGVPHHLLGELDPAAGELPPTKFRSMARAAASVIVARGMVPVVAGGSNSYIHAMLAERYDEKDDVFGGEVVAGRRGLSYGGCCLLWVDVEETVLAEHLDRRVDEMLGLGMVEELGRYFAGEGFAAEERHPGLGKAIGVPEFKEFFRRRTAAAYDEAVAEIKENTRRLAVEQVRKIARLEEMGWELRRVDATEVVAARLAGGDRKAEAAAWEGCVLGPCVQMVESFLQLESKSVSLRER